MNRYAPFERIVNKLTNISLAASMVLLAALMLLGATDVIGRFFGHPVKAAYQFSEIMQVWVVCLAWAFTTTVMGHAKLDLLVARFNPRAQRLIDLTTTSIALIVFALIGWQGIDMVNSSLKMGRLVDIIFIPIFPFQIVVTIGAFFNCLVLIMQIINLSTQPRKGVN